MPAPTRVTAFIGRSSTRRLTQGWQARGRETSEFRREDITGGRTHCGVCPRRRQCSGSYE